MVLKKEVVSSSNGNSGESNVDNADLASYRQCLVRTLHSCSVRFTSVAPAVVPLVRALALATGPACASTVVLSLSCWSSCQIVMKVRLEMCLCL